MFTVRHGRTSFHVRCMENHIKSGTLTVERTGMLYISKLLCLQRKKTVCCTLDITKFMNWALNDVKHGMLNDYIWVEYIFLLPVANVFGRKLPWFGASSRRPSGYRVPEFQHNKPAYTGECKHCLLCGRFKPRSSSGITLTPQRCDMSLLWMRGGYVALASAV